LERSVTESETNLIEMTADIVAAYVGNNSVQTNALGELIASVHAALTATGRPAAKEAPALTPVVSIRSSVKQDYIVCLEDGATLKMLTRYLRNKFAMSPDDYRAKWGLPKDYPMVAPAYAEKRRGLALKIGLGRIKVAEDVAKVATTVKRGARKAVETIEATVAPETKAPRRRLGIKVATEAAQARLSGEPAPADA
jgi:predicted transcriptional regulator